MSQFNAFFFSELKSTFKQLIVYFYAFIFSLITFLAIYFSDKFSIGIPIGNVFLNQNFSIISVFGAITSFAVYLLPTISSTSATKDFDSGFYEILFASPIKKSAYLIGRFLAAWITMILTFLPSIGAYIIAIQFVDAHHLAETTSWDSFGRVFWMVIPNTFIIASFTFSVALLFRSIVATYVMVIVLVTSYSIAVAFLGADLQYQELASYFDPFGNAAFQNDTKYWTVSDKNTKTYEMSTLMMTNRLIWIGFSLLVLVVAYTRFSFSASVTKLFGRAKKLPQYTKIALINALPVLNPQFSWSASWKQLFARIWVEYQGVVKHISFIVIAGFGLIILVFNLYYAGGRAAYGVASVPVSYWLADVSNSLNLLFGLIIIVFFGGQMVWADRDQKTASVSDALPVHNWVWVLSKIGSLWMIIYSLQLLSIICCIGYQIIQGYYECDLMPFIKINLFLHATVLCFWAVICVAIHILVNNKALGYFISIVLYLLPTLFNQIGMNHLLFQPWTQHFMVVYSDMNGMFPYVREIVWYKAYLAELSLLFMLLGILFWVRQRGLFAMHRVQNAIGVFRKPAMLYSGLFILLLIGCTAGKIYYDTALINEHITDNDHWKVEKVDLEKKYKRFENRPQPKITNSIYHIELYPTQEAVTINGTFTLVNTSSQPIDTLHVFYQDRINMIVSIAGAVLMLDDKRHHYLQFKLTKALVYSDSVLLSFTCDYRKKAMENWVSQVNLTGNGTFINKNAFSPIIGYNGTMELYEKWDRKKYGLKPKDRLAKDSDSSGRMNTYVSLDGDYGHIKATIGTDIDQIAIAPGDLVHKEIRNGRAYFTYQSTEPILNFYSFLSAKYVVTKEIWNGIGLEVYHHPSHTRNVPRMLKAMKDAIAFCSQNYSPYHYKHARIVEFPRYQQFAQSFPNTMPYSEGIGFILDLDKEKDLDIVYYTVAHEIAHQWWGHQVAPANVEGCTFMVESMAQYTALQVMENEYGSEKMKKFLKYEMDNYLGFRGMEQEKELPLIKNQHQQYIYYQKGSIATYALGKYVGFDAINNVLGEFIKTNYHKASPYPTSLDLYKKIKSVVPDSLLYLSEDMFEKIILYDNRTTDAVYEKLADSTYKVYFTVNCSKFNADSVGLEKVVPLHDYVDIAVTDKDDKTIVKKRVKLTNEKTDFEWIVKQKPVKAAIDPDYLLVDRVPADNYRTFKEADKLE